MMDKKVFFESTMYAGHGYGSKKEDVDKILNNKKSVLATMDICGAMALKSRYDNVITIYIKKDRKELISSILNKKCSHEDKVNRLISIEDEKRNEEICDYVVSVTNKDYESSVKEIEEILGI
jgi:guanylate kinase